MSLADQIKADAVNVFCNPSEFGESVTYKPHGGAPKTVRAVVERGHPTQRPDRQFAPIQGKSLAVSIPNDADSGVTVVNVTFDQVDVAPMVGGTPETFRVLDILSQDPGMWRLELRRD